MAIKGTDLLVVQDPADKKFYKTTLSSLSTGISGVDTTLPIKNVSAVGSTPNIAIDEATTTKAGAVARLATAADVVNTNNDPSTTAVVTADLLNATNKALQTAVGGGLSQVNADLPIISTVKTVADGGDDKTPFISIRETTTELSGAVERLATAADVISTNTSPSTTAVVTADLLRATNFAIENFKPGPSPDCVLTSADGGEYDPETPGAPNNCELTEISGGIYAYPPENDYEPGFISNCC